MSQVDTASSYVYDPQTQTIFQAGDDKNPDLIPLDPASSGALTEQLSKHGQPDEVVIHGADSFTVKWRQVQDGRLSYEDCGGIDDDCTDGEKQELYWKNVRPENIVVVNALGYYLERSLPVMILAALSNMSCNKVEDTDAIDGSGEVSMDAGTVADTACTIFVGGKTIDCEGDEDGDKVINRDDRCPFDKGVLEGCPDTNQPPVIKPIPDQTVVEGKTLSFEVTATDQDGDSIILSAYPTSLDSPVKYANFDPIKGTFSWTPKVGDAGKYQVEFKATDGKVTVSLLVDIVVIDQGDLDSDGDGVKDSFDACPDKAGPSWRKGCPIQNHAPIIIPIPNQTIAEGNHLELVISVSDPDGNVIQMNADPIPTGAQFDSIKGVFDWIPNFTQSGIYNITFSATDGSLSDSQKVLITVADTPLPPKLEMVEDKTVSEGQALSFQVKATDPDGDLISYSVEPLPQGAQFNEATGWFLWIPDLTQAGFYPINFSAAAGGQKVTQNMTITVLNVNQAPLLAPIGDKTVNTGEVLSFTLLATDADGDGVTYDIQPLPNGATLNTKTGAFQWKPDYTQAGKYSVSFSATDGSLSDFQNVLITVEKDVDVDGVPDKMDNCPNFPNPDQSDLNKDGLGDACICDPDGNGIIGDNQIPDTVLRGVVKTALGLNSADPITLTQTKQLLSLDYTSTCGDPSPDQISNLVGLQCFPQLKELWLGMEYPCINPISDLTPLGGLTQLQSLGVRNSQVADIGALAGLVKLEELYLDGGKIVEVVPLSGLTKLSVLTLDSNKIADLGPLATLNNLNLLDLRYNQISDLTFLQDLVNLTSLGLSSNPISDIGWLLINPGLGKGDEVDLGYDLEIPLAQIDQLCAKGTTVVYPGITSVYCN